MASPARSARVYPSLVRTIHVAGIERTAAGLLILAALMLLFAFELNWVSVLTALAIFFVAFPALRRATATDDQILAVYRAHVIRSVIYESQPSAHHPHTDHPATF